MCEPHAHADDTLCDDCCPVLSDAVSFVDTSGFFKAEPDSAAVWTVLLCHVACKKKHVYTYCYVA